MCGKTGGRIPTLKMSFWARFEDTLTHHTPLYRVIASLLFLRDRRVWKQRCSRKETGPSHLLAIFRNTLFSAYCVGRKLFGILQHDCPMTLLPYSVTTPTRREQDNRDAGVETEQLAVCSALAIWRKRPVCQGNACKSEEELSRVRSSHRLLTDLKQPTNRTKKRGCQHLSSREFCFFQTLCFLARNKSIRQHTEAPTRRLPLSRPYFLVCPLQIFPVPGCVRSQPSSSIQGRAAVSPFFQMPSLPLCFGGFILAGI